MNQLIIIFFLITTLGLAAVTIIIPEDYPTIQEGIDASVEGDSVLVAPGTYYENIDFNGKSITVCSWYATTLDTSYISQTIIDGNQDGSVVKFESEEDSSSVLSGFMITNGYSSYGFYGGGGIYCNSSNPCLENVIIMNNSSESYGGGIYCEESSPRIESVIIKGNLAGEDGGGIFCYFYSNLYLENVTIMDNSADCGGGICCETSSPSLKKVTITDNSADCSGGGIFCWNSHPSLENVTITENSAEFYGGGIYCEYSFNMNLENVMIADNYSESYGGGILYSSSSLSLKNVTITNNSAEDFGGGIYCSYSSIASLVNCIFWNNTPQEVEFACDNDPNTITIAYSDIDGGEEGILTNNNGTVNWLDGNIDADPLFVDALVGDYHLSENSPCIDTGIAYFEYEGEVLVDLSSDEYFGIAPDMGAYEFGLVNTDEVIIQNSKLNIQNYPNPFNPETTISFSTPENTENIEISIYNIKGQRVKSFKIQNSKFKIQKVVWDGKNENGRKVSSGIYLLRLKSNNETVTKKLMMIK